MPNPFPGMNPYLEHPTLWLEIHHRLITAIANSLAPQIQPGYIVAMKEQIYEMQGEQSLLVGITDVAIQELLSGIPMISISNRWKKVLKQSSETSG